MDATQFFTLTNSSSPAVGGGAAGLPAAKVEVRGSEFADLFNAQMQPALRQTLAVPEDGQLALQMVPLGPKINVITADAPSPDLASLASFALAQGLDEEAVKTLFGVQPVKTVAPTVDLAQIGSLAGLVMPTLAPIPTPTPVQAPNPNQGGSFNLPTELVQAKELAPLGVISALALPISAAPKLMPTDTDPVNVTIPALQALPIGLPASGAALIKDLASKQKGVHLGELPSEPEVALLSLQITALPLVSKSLMSAPVTPVAPEAVALVMPDALRIRFENPSQALTRRLSLMSGTSQKENWGELLASAAESTSAGTAPIKPWQSLSIDVPSSLLNASNELALPELSELDLGAAPQVGLPVAADIARSGPAVAGAGSLVSPATPSALAEQRGEQYQQLADRLGQAVAQRLVSQIERGEWKLELRLQPQSLGRIDVALEMHAGGLDAQFTADNSVTRDLIAQGAAKLRDALAQSGMAVASVWVGGDQSKKSDGNPTPGRSFKDQSSAGQKNEDEPVSAVRAAGRVSMTPDGLDVLA